MSETLKSRLPHGGQAESPINSDVAGYGVSGQICRSVLSAGLVVALVWPASCVRQAANAPRGGEDAEITARGSVEVTARLEEVPEGAIFERDLYNYATILKYQVLAVHRGHVDRPTLYVAHYNPFKSRADAADRRVAGIGGHLRSFSGGQVHRLALEVPVDDYYMGAIVNKYFGQDVEPIYWAVWTNLVSD